MFFLFCKMHHIHTYCTVNDRCLQYSTVCVPVQMQNPRNSCSKSREDDLRWSSWLEFTQVAEEEGKVRLSSVLKLMNCLKWSLVIRGGTFILYNLFAKISSKVTSILNPCFFNVGRRKKKTSKLWVSSYLEETRAGWPETSWEIFYDQDQKV